MKASEIQSYLKNCQGIKFSNFDSLENPQSGDNLSHQAQKSSKTPRNVASQLDMNSPSNTVRTVVKPDAGEPTERSKISRKRMSNNKPFVCESPDGSMISPRKLNFSGQLQIKQEGLLR